MQKTGIALRQYRFVDLCTYQPPSGGSGGSLTRHETENSAGFTTTGTSAADPAGMPRLEVVQRNYIHQVLNATAGNKRRAADILGITRRTLYRWLE